jgi:NUMOD3 motif
MKRKFFTIAELLELSPKKFVNNTFFGGKTGKPAWNRGLKMSDAHRLKISLAQRGINRVSSEVRSKALKGRIFSPEHRANISKARKGIIGLLGENPRARKVRCPKGTFATIKEAAQAMNCDGGTLRSRAKKRWPGYEFLD